jgi:hypothetical protein
VEGKYGHILGVHDDNANLPAIEHELSATFNSPVSVFPPAEPLFLLRGQDRLAPMILRLYADIAASHGRHDVANGVLAQCREMEAWQEEHVERVKLPD